MFHQDQRVNHDPFDRSRMHFICMSWTDEYFNYDLLQRRLNVTFTQTSVHNSLP